MIWNPSEGDINTTKEDIVANDGQDDESWSAALVDMLHQLTLVSILRDALDGGRVVLVYPEEDRQRSAVSSAELRR